METQILIDTLKKVLKAKGISYIKLAEMLDISLPSVRRIFSEGTFTLERYFKICNLIGVSYRDLLTMMDIGARKVEFELTQKQEEYFADHIEYLVFFNLIYQYKSIKALAREFNIDDISVGKILAQLEKLGLIEWLPGNEVKIIGSHKLSFSSEGPITKKYGKETVAELMDSDFDQPNQKENLFLPFLSKPAQKKYIAKFEELLREMRDEMDVEMTLKVPSEHVGVFYCLRPYKTFYERLRNFKA